MAQAPAAFTPVPGRWIAMTILLVAQFMNLIDVTIVNVALPSIQSAFAATSSQIEWVVAGYILFFAVLLLPSGRLGDIVGRRRMFILGVAVFTLGSAFCGLAPSIETLVAARVFQAVGAAMMTPQTLAIIPVIFAPHERGAAFALTGLTAGLAAVAGPMLGGWLIEGNIWGLGWRPIFLVNIPVGIIAILAALRYLPRVTAAPGLGLDLVGTALAGAALLLVIFPLIEGRQVGWPVWCFVMMAAAVPVALAFVLWLKRQAARGGAQVLPASLFGNRNFILGTTLAAMLFSGVPGFFLVLALYLQSGYGLTPLHSGLTTVPFSLGVLVASIISGRLGSRWPRRRITIGALMLAGAMIWVRLIVQRTGADLVRLDFAPALLMGGIGLGTAISPMFQTILANVAGQDTGAASGGLQAFNQMGAAIGVAVMGEMFFATLGPALAAGGDPHPAYAGAITFALIYNIVMFAAVGLMVWLLPRPGAVAVRPVVVAEG
jgi:EmrB/QacA subfamily drug resistance transporter